MNIPAIVKSGLNTCHNVASSIAKEALIIQRISSTYDPDTGQATPTIEQTSARCFLFDYETSEYSETITADDRYILLDKKDGNITFGVKDQIKIDNIYYEVMDIERGATENFYSVQIRKTDKPLI